MKYKILYPTGYQVKDILNDNIDVNIIFENGDTYFATLFTIKNIEHLMKNAINEIEKKHFWATDMIIVKDLRQNTINETIDYLINTNDLNDCFTLIENDSIK